MLFYRRWPRAAAVFLWVLLPLTARAADDGLGARRHSQNAALFSRAAYEKNVAHLAGDALEGRGTGQEGIDKAAEFIAAWFEKCGVEPAGDEDTYFQNFTLKLSNRIAPGTRLAIGVRGRTSRKPAKLHEEFVPFPFSKSGSFRGDVVFAGYGIVSDDLEYNDYGDLDVADKVVLILRRSPKFAEFSEGDMTFRAKAARASARDATALLVVNPDGDEDGDRLYNFDGTAGAGFGFGGGSYGIPMVHVHRSVADRMLKAGGLGDVTTLQKRIESRKRPASGALKGVSVRGRVNIEPVASPVRNVAGLIPGDGPQSDEIIVLGAHYDHLGIRHKGEDSFNPERDISNGADDNASGTSLIMTLADAYTRGERPNRSLLLLLFTGEERGLLGSHYFANHPTVDLKKCVAMLNFDMVGRLKDEKLEVGGMRTGNFTEMVDRLAEPYGLVIKDGGGGSGPSDHTSFYNKDIPVLFFFTGIHKQYHRPEDDTALLNMEGAIRIAKFAADCIDEIDASAEPPTFAEDTRWARLARQDAEEDDVDAQPPRQRRVRLGITPSPDDTESGVLVADVSEDSPAQRAGVREGDRIVKLGDVEIESFDDLAAALGEFRRGDTTKLTVRREGRSIELVVVFGRRESRRAEKTEEPTKQDRTASAVPSPETSASEVSPSAGRKFEEQLEQEIKSAKVLYDSRLDDTERFQVEYDVDLTDANSNDEERTLIKLITELQIDMYGKKAQYDALCNAKAEDLPISAELQKRVESDPTVRMFAERLSIAEEAVAVATAEKRDEAKTRAAKALREFAADRLASERAQKVLASQLERIETAKREFLMAQERLVTLKDNLLEARVARLNREAKRKRLKAMIEECDRLKRDYEMLLEQQRAIKHAPRLAELAEVIRASLKDSQDDFEVSLRLDPAHAGAPIEIVLRPRAIANPPADRKLPGANVPVQPARSEKITKKPAKPLAANGNVASAHGGAPDDSGRSTMPGVRLGIMPTYGEATEDGYEISGVVEDGPAAKAGMRDSDRIYQIGDERVKDVYSYMDALRKYKPGDNVRVVVLRDGKKVTLTIKTAAQKSREAA